MRRMLEAIGRGLWRRRLLAWEEEGVRECSALLHNTILQDNVNDVWRWSLDPIHAYSVREAYHFLTTYGEPENGNLVDNIWHKYIPSKVSLFLWRLLRDRLPTKDNLVQRRVLHQDDVACVAGCGSAETAQHLFFRVQYIQFSLVSCVALVRYFFGFFW